VKFAISTLLFVCFMVLQSPAQSPRPVPPGLRHAQELQAQNEHESPSATSRHAPSITELKTQADQLAELAASIPISVQNAGKGLLEKDLLQKLKQIEKLSKHLRNELDH